MLTDVIELNKSKEIQTLTRGNKGKYENKKINKNKKIKKIKNRVAEIRRNRRKYRITGRALDDFLIRGYKKQFPSIPHQI